MSRKRLLSGMQPSAESLHLGNYLGALHDVWAAMTHTEDATSRVIDEEREG